MHWNTSFNNFCSISVTQSKERVAATASRELAVVEEVVDASPNTIVGFGERASLMDLFDVSVLLSKTRKVLLSVVVVAGLT